MSISRLVSVGAGALALVAVAGCAELSERRLDYRKTERISVDTVLVEPGAGDVAVRGGQVSEVTIERVIRYHGGEPRDATYRVDGSTLVLDTDCGRRCSVSYDVTVPEGVSVRGESGSGDVELSRVRAVDVKLGSGNLTVTDVAGPVHGETGSGDVTVSGAKGETWLHAGSGNISGRGLGGGALVAETGSGDITLDLAVANSVRARASSGSVELTVAAGRYRVSTSTGSGSRTVQVTEDPAATALLDLQTGSGDITVTQR